MSVLMCVICFFYLILSYQPAQYEVNIYLFIYKHNFF